MTNNPFSELSRLIHDWLLGAGAPSIKAYRAAQLWPGMETWLTFTGWLITQLARHMPDDLYVRGLHTRRAHDDLVRREGAFTEAIYGAWRDGRLGACVERIPQTAEKKWPFLEDQLGIRGFTIPGMEDFLQKLPPLEMGHAAGLVYAQICDQPIGFFTHLVQTHYIPMRMGELDIEDYKRRWAEILCYRGENVEHLIREYNAVLAGSRAKS